MVLVWIKCRDVVRCLRRGSATNTCCLTTTAIAATPRNSRWLHVLLVMILIGPHRHNCICNWPIHATSLTRLAICSLMWPTPLTHLVHPGDEHGKTQFWKHPQMPLECPGVAYRKSGRVRADQRHHRRRPVGTRGECAARVVWCISWIVSGLVIGRLCTIFCLCFGISCASRSTCMWRRWMVSRLS